MKTACQECRTPLEAGGDAYICSYECTFCPTCALRLELTCPNCAGELVNRPRRDGEAEGD